MSGLSVVCVGELSRRNEGVGKTSNKAYYSAEVAYMGGSLDLFLTEEEYRAFPDVVGQVVKVTAKGKIDNNGKLRLSNVVAAVASDPATRRSAAG